MRVSVRVWFYWIEKFVKWTDEWQVELNTDKCKVISNRCDGELQTIVVIVVVTPSYLMNNSVLEVVDEVGVTLCNDYYDAGVLTHAQHCSKAAVVASCC